MLNNLFDIRLLLRIKKIISFFKLHVLYTILYNKIRTLRWSGQKTQSSCWLCCVLIWQHSHGLWEFKAVWDQLEGFNASVILTAWGLLQNKVLSPRPSWKCNNNVILNGYIKHWAVHELQSGRFILRPLLYNRHSDVLHGVFVPLGTHYVACKVASV